MKTISKTFVVKKTVKTRTKAFNDLCSGTLFTFEGDENQTIHSLDAWFEKLNGRLSVRINILEEVDREQAHK